jgi:hypothetical protein
MTSLRTLASEEPIAPNSSVTALDESTQRLVLAEFSVDNACRYSVRWERRALFFDKESLEALAALCALYPGV